MHEKLTALIDEHASPKHCCKRDLHDQLHPVGQAMTTNQTQMSEYRRMLADLELSEHDPAINGKLEMLHQTLDAMDREAAALQKGFRRLIKASEQWDRYLGMVQRDLTKWEADEAAKAAGGATIAVSAPSVAASRASARVHDQRAPDQQTAVEEAFAAGTLPEVDRRATVAGTSPAG